jgi:hypothetical protein
MSHPTQEQQITRSIRFSEEMMKEIGRLAEEGHRSVQAQVIMMLEERMNAMPAQNCAACRKTQEKPSWFSRMLDRIGGSGVNLLPCFG